MFRGEVRPKTGAPCLFSSEMEEDIALFMKHCTFLHIPRTKKMMKEDILHFIQYKQVQAPRMADDRPGTELFTEFAKFNSSNIAVVSMFMPENIH